MQSASQRERGGINGELSARCSHSGEYSNEMVVSLRRKEGADEMRLLLPGKSRAAMSTVAMPRLRRASARLRPSLRSACPAGTGIEETCGMDAVSAIPHCSSLKVC